MADHAQAQTPALAVALPRGGIGGFLRRPGMGRLTAIVALFLLWELGGLVLDPTFIAPPSRVAATFGDMLDTPGLQKALGVTMVELIVAFVVSVVFGTVVGLMVGLNGVSRRTLLPIIVFLYGVPQVTIMPLLILSFGIGPTLKIIFGITHAIFPIILTVSAGVQDREPALLRSAYALGASRWQIFRHITLPHMVPAFFSGMRQGMVGAMIGVLLAELYVSTAGVGFFSRLFADQFDAPKLFGLVVLIAAMAVLLNELLRTLEVRFSRWKAH